MDGEMPPGYRFYPTEEELVGFYLREKLQGRRSNELQRLIPLLNIYDYSPWDLPKLSGAQCRQDGQVEEWFFFVARQEKEARGGRPNRLTSNGYWKATGSPSYVYSSSSSNRRIIGQKRTMVFYKGRAPGSKTHWKMNQYTAIDNANLLLDFSLCRVYVRTKCIRSYDRRPSVAFDHQPNPPLEMMMLKGETSGSSTEENNDGCNNLHISDMDVNMGDEPLWKWEQLLNSTEWMII